MTGCALAIERLFADAGAPAGLFTTLVARRPSVAEMSPRDHRRPAGRGRHAHRQRARRSGRRRRPPGGAQEDGARAGRLGPVRGARRRRPRGRRGRRRAGPASATAARAASRAKRFIVPRPWPTSSSSLLDAPAGRLTRVRHRSGRWRADDLRDQLHAQVLASVARGRRLVAGGRHRAGRAGSTQPTVLDHVTPRMTAFDEETFGPVAAVVRARDDDHAVELANDTTYGLGAAVWSPLVARARGRASGSAPAPSSSTPWSPPTRGCRSAASAASGYGRELSAEGTASSPTSARCTSVS